MSVPFVPKELDEIAERVARGERPTETVRSLLRWFHGYERRTRRVVDLINGALDYKGLATVPYFNWTYLGADIRFVPRSEAGRDTTIARIVEDPTTRAQLVELATAPEQRQFEESLYRLSRLEIANRKPVSVRPDSTTETAVTTMLKHDYSQLPVMTTERDIKGLFSWKSLASRWSQGRECNYVREAMEGHAEVGSDATLFEAIRSIQEHDCVLVRDSTKIITGIITAYDISTTFHELAGPFLILSEIENIIRGFIGRRFKKEELAAACFPGDQDREINTVADLTFGEYIRLIEDPQRWARLGLQIDRIIFIKDLQEIRRIRNDVMHFEPEGIEDNDLGKLRDFVNFLQRLQRIRTQPEPAIAESGS